MIGIFTFTDQIPGPSVYHKHHRRQQNLQNLFLLACYTALEPVKPTKRL